MFLKSMMKIPNKLKTAAKVFVVFLQENGLKFGIGKFDMWHFKSLQCIAMGKKVAKIGDPQ